VFRRIGLIGSAKRPTPVCVFRERRVQMSPLDRGVKFSKNRHLYFLALHCQCALVRQTRQRYVRLTLSDRLIVYSVASTRPKKICQAPIATTPMKQKAM